MKIITNEDKMYEKGNLYMIKILCTYIYIPGR